MGYRLKRQRRRESPASSAGKPETLSPTPTTAHPSCGLPSTRIPASFLPSTQTSLGHLMAQVTGAQASAASHTATAVARGRRAWRSSRSRITTDRAGPSPARDPGAPLTAAAGALLVGGHDRAVRSARGGQLAWRARWWSRSAEWCTRGRPSGPSSRPQHAPLRRGRCQGWLGVAAVDRQGEHPVGVLVDDQLPGANVGEGGGVGGQKRPTTHLDLDLAPRVSPVPASPSWLRFKATLPKRSVVRAWAATVPSSPIRGSESCTRSSVSGSSGSPASASAAPAAR